MHKFVSEVVGELSKQYEVVHKFHSLQKIIEPVDSDAEDTQEINKDSSVLIKRDGAEKMYRRKLNKLYWKYFADSDLAASNQQKKPQNRYASTTKKSNMQL